MAISEHDEHTGDLYYSLGFKADNYKQRPVDVEMQMLMLESLRRFIHGDTMPLGE